MADCNPIMIKSFSKPSGLYIKSEIKTCIAITRECYLDINIHTLNKF